MKNYSFPIITFLTGLVVLLSSCEKEKGISPSNIDCSEAILFNSKEIKKQGQNFNISVKVGNEIKVLVEDADYDFWWARLHPDKTKFLCYRSPVGDNKEDNDYSRAELWQFNTDGTDGKKLIDLEDHAWHAQGVADWSPDGNHIVMIAELAEDNNKPNNRYFQLVRTDSDGSNPKQLTSGPGLRADPSWSPDGNQIIYVAFPEDYDPQNLILDILFQGPLEVHIADISNNGNLSNIRQLTDDNIRDNDPYMAPDGSYIAWESFVNGAGVIRAYDIDEQKISILVERGELPCCPSYYEDPDKFLIHSLKLLVDPFYIAEYDRNTDSYKAVIKDKDHAYINPQWVCWPN